MKKQNAGLRTELDAASPVAGEESSGEESANKSDSSSSGSESDEDAKKNKGSSDSEDDSSDSDSDAEAKTGKKTKNVKKILVQKKKNKSSEDSDDDDESTGSSGSDSDDSSSSSDSDDDSDDSDSSGYSSGSSSDEEVDDKEHAELLRDERRKRWLLTDKDLIKIQKEKEKVQAEEQKRKDREQKRIADRIEKQKNVVNADEDAGFDMDGPSKSVTEQRLKAWKEQIDAKEVQSVLERVLQELLNPAVAEKMSRTERRRKSQILSDFLEKLELPNVQLALLRQECSEELARKKGSLPRLDTFRQTLVTLSTKVFPLFKQWISKRGAVEESMQGYNAGKGLDRETILFPLSLSKQLEQLVALLEMVDGACYKGLQHPDDEGERIENLVRTIHLLRKSVDFFTEIEGCAPQICQRAKAIMNFRLMGNLYSMAHGENRLVFAAVIEHFYKEQLPATSAYPYTAEDFKACELPHSDAEIAAYLESLEEKSQQQAATGASTQQGSILGETYLEQQEMETSRRGLQATLMHLYNLFLTGEYRRAKGMMHYLDLQAQVEKTTQSPETDQKIFVLWNRIIAQMGLAAFKQGLIYEAHVSLLDLNSYTKAKELLMQGVSFQRPADYDREKEEFQRRNQIPFHMQISLELLECAASVCGLLMEVPNMALIAYNDQTGQRRRYQTIYSKPIRMSLEKAQKSTVLAPAEATRDKIVDAARALQQGDWRRCYEIFTELKPLQTHREKLNLEDNLFPLLLKQVKKEAVRIYLWNFASSYQTISLAALGDMFELETSEIRSVLHRMIYDRKLAPQIMLDKTASYLVNSRGEEASGLQQGLTKLAGSLDYRQEGLERQIDFKLGRSLVRGNQFMDKGGNFHKGQGKGGNSYEGEGRKIFDKSRDGLARVDRFEGRSRDDGENRNFYQKGGKDGKGKGKKGKGKGKGFPFGFAGNEGGKGKGSGKGNSNRGAEARGWNLGVRASAVA
ncbi:unnamed protein product [Amoebophrya sp. A25]|nr:unnamed protein product [Amoebophrya sp. A25]|eukprot:GSA25T00019338001.1